MKEFRDRTAVVTGAASGIGRALALRFAREGMKVVLSDIQERAVEKAAQSLRDEGHDVLAVETDVSDPESVKALAKAAVDAYGKVHVLCNNAGVAVSGGLIWERTPLDWEWAFRVNVWGVINGISTFVPIMLSQDEEGHVVNTSSAVGIMPNQLGIYSVTKKAVVSISEYLYRNLHEVDAKIKASVLCPGYVQTAITTSERHRQGAYRNPRGQSLPVDVELQSRMRKHIEHGHSPDDIASMVVEAIREERFWVFTGEEQSDILASYHQSIARSENPVFSQFDFME